MVQWFDKLTTDNLSTGNFWYTFSMRNIIDLYKEVFFSRNLLFLYLNRVIIQIGLGFIGIFGIIFFYEQFSNSVEKVVLLYAALYLIFTITAHIGAKFIQRIGMRNMMIFSTVFLVGSILSRLLWETNVPLFLSLFFFFAILDKMFYWIPYHIEFAAFTKNQTRGKQMAILTNASAIVLAILPLVSGYILIKTGYTALFATATIVSILSVIPLFFIKETKENYTWSFSRLIKEFFQKENRSLVTSHMANGFQNGVASVIWPIFVFILLSGNYFKVGLISSLVILTIISLRFLVGGIIDNIGTQKILRYGMFLSFSGWIIKVFVESGLGVFISDTYHSLGRLVNQMSFNISTYDQAADNGHFIDEYTVLKESSFLFGKCIILVFSLLIIPFLGIKITFILAALSIFGMGLISSKTQIN